MSNQNKFFLNIFIYMMLMVKCCVLGFVFVLSGSGRLMVTPLAYCATEVLFSHLPAAFLHRD